MAAAAVIQSTSWTLHEAVRFDRPGEKPLGAGEASQGPMAAAIANAFAHASGRRLRELPFSPSRVQTLLG